MSYPDPYHPQQPPPGQYPPAPPGPHGYGYPPNGGYPPAQPYPPYGAQPQPPYYPPPAVPPPAAKRDDGNSRVWRILDNLMFFASDSASQGLGKNARERVKTGLIILGVAIIGIALVIGIAVIASK